MAYTKTPNHLVFHDLKFALRVLSKNRGFTLVAVLTLAIGIGASSALFSLCDRLVLRPLEYCASDQLVRVWSNNPVRSYNAPYISWPRYQEIARQQTAFTALSAAAFDAPTLTEQGDPVQLTALRVTANFFPTLGVQPVLGRNFTAEEDQPGGPDVVLLTNELWKPRFGGRSSIVGEMVRLNGNACLVVGILPPLTRPYHDIDAMIPLVFDAPNWTKEQIVGGASYLEVKGCLRPGVSFAQTFAETKAIAERDGVAHPERVDAKAVSELYLFADEMASYFRPMCGALVGGVALVMLIACANVSSLFLGRLSAQHRDIALRLSLGAPRGRLIRQFLLESLLLA